MTEVHDRMPEHKYNHSFLNELYMEYAYGNGSFDGKADLKKKAEEFNNDYTIACQQYQKEYQEYQKRLIEEQQQQQQLYSQNYAPVNF